MTRKKKTPAKAKSRKKDLREEINVLALIEALEQYILGKNEMTATQVTAALALLKKMLPDKTEQSLKTQGTQDLSHENALEELE